MQAEITRQRAILTERSNVTPERIVAELTVIAFSDLGDYIRIHPHGTASIELGNIPPGATRAIASLDTETNRTAIGRQTMKVRIKLHDKQAALVSLAKMLGMLREGGVTVVANAHNSVKMAMLSTEDLRKVLDSGVFDAPIEAEAHIL